MKKLFQLMVFSLMWFTFQSCQKENEEQLKPNIIIIYADDLGYGDLTSYGGDIPSPNIDRIGEEGIRFTDFYVSAPACTPSRYSLLTGSYPQRSEHGLLNALMPANSSEHYLDQSEKTMAEFLKSDGYTTAIFGKWHLGFQNENDMPESHGFDEFTGFRGGCIDYFTHVYGEIGHDWYVDGQETKEEGYSTNLITNHAIGFINRMSENKKPFFAYLAYNAPHYGKTDPAMIVDSTVVLSEGNYQGYKIMNTLQAPPDYFDKFETTSDPYRRAYKAMVAELDDNIGRVFSTLEEKNLLNNTIVWFISDNGGYSESYFGHADNGGLRGEKGTLWEGGIKIPAVLMWKGKIDENQVIGTPVINADVLPTILSILDIAVSEEEKSQIDGMDISPVLFENREIERPLFWKYNRQTAIREGAWKLVNDSLLFNLKDDPDETTDLAGEHPEIVKDLNTKYHNFFQKISPE